MSLFSSHLAQALALVRNNREADYSLRLPNSKVEELIVLLEAAAEETLVLRQVIDELNKAIKELEEEAA